MTKQIKGILTALLTPFDTAGGLDEVALRAVVDRSIDGGVDGVVACGSTGEFTALSSDERRRVVEIVVDQAGGRVTVVAQTGATSTAEAIRLSRHAESVGADVVMLVAPYYEPLSQDLMADYMRSVAESISVPVMLYNNPSATGVNLLPETVGALARQVDNIHYVKNTTADMAQTAELIHNYQDVVLTIGGWDTLLQAALVEGAAAMMVGTANLIPDAIVEVWQAVQSGDLQRARTSWNRVFPVMDAVMQGPYISTVKAVLGAVGLPVGVPREPAAVADAAATARIAGLVAAANRHAGVHQ